MTASIRLYGTSVVVISPDPGIWGGYLAYCGDSPVIRGDISIQAEFSGITEAIDALVKLAERMNIELSGHEANGKMTLLYDFVGDPSPRRKAIREAQEEAKRRDWIWWRDQL